MNEIRKLPGVEDRVETGPVQFGDDWPWIFIRGDNCFAYRMALAGLRDETNNPFDVALVQSLIDLFDGCNVNTGLVERLKENDERRSE